MINGTEFYFIKKSLYIIAHSRSLCWVAWGVACVATGGLLKLSPHFFKQKTQCWVHVASMFIEFSSVIQMKIIWFYYHRACMLQVLHTLVTLSVLLSSSVWDGIAFPNYNITIPCRNQFHDSISSLVHSSSPLASSRTYMQNHDHITRVTLIWGTHTWSGILCIHQDLICNLYSCSSAMLAMLYGVLCGIYQITYCMSHIVEYALCTVFLCRVLAYDQKG